MNATDSTRHQTARCAERQDAGVGTDWALVHYKYGNTLQEAREKLQYDLFYIKHASIGLDTLIMFQTIKIVRWGRDAQ